MAKACRADIKKAIVKTAAKRMNMELYSPVDGAEDTFYIKNSARKTGDKYNTKRNNILNDVKQDMLKLNKSFKDKVRAVFIKTDDTSDMQVVLKISPMYVEHEFNKLPEEKRNNVFVDLEEDEAYFQDSQSIFEQDFTEGLSQKELDNMFSYTAEMEEVPSRSTAKVDENKYLQIASGLVNPAIKELDNYLLDFLKNFNVKTRQFEELKSRLGVDALGATDVLNKLIWYVKNRNEETLPEESAHMLVSLMGENHPDIKELLTNITNWSEYNDIKDQYLPLYKDENKVKIEAVGKLIAKSLVKNYKANGLDRNKLQKALDNILKFIESILDTLNLSNIFFYNESVADHIAINVLSGNKDYIYKIKNLNPNLNPEEEIEKNPNAKKIINKFSSRNVKMTGSLAIARTENIRRPQGQGIHDIDFKVKSFDVFNNEVLPKIPNNAVPAHYGWHKKTYSTYAYLIPSEGYTIKVLERKDDFSNGWVTDFELYNERNEKVKVTQLNVMAVDFFVYKDGSNQKDFNFSSDFIPASLVYEGKMSLGGKSNPYFFSRDKDQEDYVLRNPKSFIPFEKHIYYQLANTKAVEELFDSNPELANQVYEALGYSYTGEYSPAALYESGIKTPDKKDYLTYSVIENNKGQKYINTLNKGKRSEDRGIGKNAYYKFIIENKGKNITTDTELSIPGRKVLEVLEKEGYVIKTDAQIVESKKSGAGYDLNVYNKPLYEFTGKMPDTYLTPQQKQQALQQYSAYLDSIFPDSKVKDVVYHGSDATFDGFLEDNLNYFGTKEIAKGYGKNLYPSIIEIKKPYYEDGGNLSNQSYEDLYDKLDESNSDGFISNGKNLYVPKTEEQIHILGNKQDVEGFKEFVRQETSTEQVKENKFVEDKTESKEEKPITQEEKNKLINSKVYEFLAKIGVSIVTLDTIRDADGNVLDATSKADMLNKVIQVVENKADMSTLPEEAAHFFVAMLGEGHPLYKEMLDKIESYEVYKQTLDRYKNLSRFRLPNGDINYDKIKKEAIGKVIAQHVINMDTGMETDKNLENVYDWWQKLWDFITDIFSRSVENPFEESAIRILMGNTEGLSEENLTEYDDEYYQLTDPVQLLIQDQANITLDNSVDPRTQQKRHIYYYGGVKGKGSVTSVYVDRWLKKIFRTDSREELQKKVDLMKAEFGDVVHEQLQDIIKSWTNPDGTRKDVQDRVEMKVGSAEFKLLNNYIEEVLDQYDVGTRFFAEFKIFDKKTQIAGSIDLMVIEPDGTVEVYDWKTQEIFKDQTDIKTYKEPMYRIQLNAYRNILEAQYGFTKFGRIRAIPIATSFNWRGGVPTNLKSIEIGSLDLESIPEDKSYLLPVALRTESTGDTQLDSLIQKLYAIYDKIQNQKNRYTKEEVFKKREELSQFRTAIRDLQLRNKVDRLVELGLVEFKKYSEKLEKKSLKGGEIPEALSILKVFSQSGVTLYELRQELLDSIDKEDTKAIKAFKDMNEKFLLMTSKVSKLMDDIQEYRKEQTDELGKRNGIMGLLNPEQAIGTLKGWFSSLSNIKQKAFRVFSMLLRRVQSVRDAKFDEASDKLLELKKNFATWAAARGMSPDKAMEMILNIDEKGKWNGNFLSTYKKEFYDARKKAIDTTNVAWLAENTVFDNEKYETSEDKQREFFESVIYASDEQENEAIITKKINEWITQHRVINPNGTLNIAALSNPNNRFLKPDEKWHTEKWKNLNKSENKPLKEMYDYFQSLIRQAEGNGMLDKYSPHFIPSIMKDKMDQLVFGDVKSLFSGKGTFQNLQVDSGTQYTSETDPTTGQIINRLPVYFTNDMGVKNEETGEVDYSRKSRDLFKVFGVWAGHMYNYEAMSAIEDDALMLLEVEKNKSSLVVDGFGRIVMEGAKPKEVEENRRNSELLENFVNYYLYDRTNGKFNDVAFKNPFSKDGKEYSLLKSLNAAIRFFSLKTLGLNIGSGTANFVGGTGNALFAAQKGIIFTKKGWASAVYKVTSGDKKAMAALDYMNILLEGRKSQLINELSLSATNGILNSDNLFIIQRTSDKAVQYPIAVAIMENNMIRDGKLVDISAFVKEKYNYNNTFYNLSESERSAMINKIEKEVTELKEKESILAIGKLDEKGNFSIPGVVKTEAGVYGELRDKIKGASKKVLGNSSRDDINAIRTTLLGSALMQFRNWMPEMVEDRVDGLQYDDELGIWTYGRMNQWVTQGFWKNSGIMLKSIVTGFGDDATKSAKDSYERMKRDAYEKGDDFTITEGEFVDMYIGNLRSMGTELLVLIAFTALILGVVGAAGDDDDDENKGTKKYIARMLKKYYSEFAFYFNPIEFTRLVKNPIPVVGLAEDFFRFTGNVLEEVYGRATGNEELTKKAKPLKYLFRALPVAKEALLIMAAFNDEFRKEWDIQLKPGGSF
jgi:hypothetical protein